MSVATTELHLKLKLRLKGLLENCHQYKVVDTMPLTLL